MSARRASMRDAGAGDSLDLLLDVICNLFGAIIFIALLTALLVRASPTIAQATAWERAEASPAGSAEVEALRAEIAALGRLLEGQDLEALAAEEAALASGRRRIDEAEAELARRQAILAEYERRHGEAEETLAGLSEQRQLLEVEVARLLEEREVLRSLTERTLRTPRRRGVQRSFPVQIVLSRDRAYVINDWSDPSMHPCDVYCRWNPRAVDVAAGPECVVHECWAGGTIFIERSVPLRADGGIPIDEGLAASAAWRMALAPLDPRTHVISLKVAPDSFESFALVRQDLVRRRFAYDVTPIVLDPRYRDAILEGTPTAQ